MSLTRFACLLITLLMLIVQTAQAAPNADDVRLTKPFIPPGFTLVDVLHFGGDRVMVVTNGTTSRVAVLRSGRARWLVTREGQRSFPAPVGGTVGEKVSDLIYRADLDRNGQPILFVTTWRADVYTLHAFRPTGTAFTEVFRVRSLERPSLDTRKMQLTAKVLSDRGDIQVERVFDWRKHTFIAPAHSAWEGGYIFTEHAEPNQDWAYNLTIRPGGAEVEIDGFQTMSRYLGDVRVSGNTVSILYRGVGPENRGRTFPEGTVLLSLVRHSNGQLVTRWQALKPQLAASLRSPQGFARL